MIVHHCEDLHGRFDFYGMYNLLARGGGSSFLRPFFYLIYSQNGALNFQAAAWVPQVGSRERVREGGWATSAVDVCMVVSG